MKMDINEMTINSHKVLKTLVGYLDKVRTYDRFNPFDLVRVFVNSNGDFTAFEALDYNLQFTSSDHKITETINSNRIIDPIQFDRFFVRVEQLAREANL